MEQYYCKLLELIFHIPKQIFAKEQLLADAKPPDTERKVYQWGFGSQKAPQKQHAHILVSFENEDTVTIVISYHRSTIEVEDVRPPYMEDCAQWLGQFIDAEKVIGVSRAVYEFDDKYHSKINFPLPLTSMLDSPELPGALVSGVAIRTEHPSGTEKIIIERLEKSIFLRLNSTKEVALKEFAIEHYLQEFVSLTDSLVRRQEPA